MFPVKAETLPGYSRPQDKKTAGGSAYCGVYMAIARERNSSERYLGEVGRRGPLGTRAFGLIFQYKHEKRDHRVATGRHDFSPKIIWLVRSSLLIISARKGRENCGSAAANLENSYIV